ncbi:MAG: UDP-N-acetylglucosamine 1-carboxyvinyltransferase [Candidatus Liptonbacteria bacterium RIFCSPLOWO2_01_FULL_56_20]|uniref:UDP-N-acetylglucosamine 1-carboxyvinyltransferase n=1 Tax=Candidatus Liptonbacteria bacterium RIFCSPLOWO2_01_FULL_56_20 TaxID=1798652 RepID=A0A1G2CKX9_9BACT|nr:MAG: UDP-N-acetylglucosamine 1-carboxyvinyltransferase [Parcubacteria group bacterium GW2011_GWB1_56_8]OGZ01078.1 MAG: UDP-N-acetylglucosamine 1-carboxyvinyltransferase [Candidatus Liptonbacteria bacterium RIFCSPLOWO2_01_FULL_56_20]
MKFVVRGGKKLRGEIEVKGAKNSALKAQAASLLFETPVEIGNLPQIEDVSRMNELLTDIGVQAEVRGERGLRLHAASVRRTELNKDIAERLRASIVLAGPLLVRAGRAVFPHPGGCVIGKRPIDAFLDGWKSFGAKIKEGAGFYEIKASSLRGTDFTFRKVSVTGTETLMMTAALARGKTILRNTACEPEIPSLAEFLNRSGAHIKGAGTPVVEIEGTGGKLLRASGAFTVIPDRIEAGSLLVLAAALGSKVAITHCNPEHLSVLISTLRDIGVPLETGPDRVSVREPRTLESIDMQTREYPGFPTDLQAPFAVLMTQAQGQSMIFETVFDGRLNYIEELNRMGARIVMCDPHRILVHGPTALQGREVESPDLRAGLAFVIAALVARGESHIKNVYQIDRGYEKIDERLRKLGADIERIA